MVVSILMIIHQQQNREKSLEVFAVNLLDVPSFVAMYLLAIYFRKKSAYHSRFMIMSTVPFLSPALARLNLPGVYVGLVLWLVFFIIEFFNKKIYRPYLIGFGFYMFNFAFVAYLLLGNRSLLDKIWGLFWG
ncbi:MAG: hypothetical protein V4683_16100 [Bacteroidota bacterium]